MKLIIPALFIALGVMVLYQTLSGPALSTTGGMMSLAYGAMSLVTGWLLFQRIKARKPASRALKFAAWGIALLFFVALALVMSFAGRAS